MSSSNRPVRRLNAAPKSRAASRKSKMPGKPSLSGNKGQKHKNENGDSYHALWISLGLGILFIALLAFWFGWPQMEALFKKSPSDLTVHTPVPKTEVKPPKVNEPTAEEKHLSEIQERVRLETQQEVSRPIVTKPKPSPVVVIEPDPLKITAPPSTVALPPVPATAPPGITSVAPTLPVPPVTSSVARAQAVDPEKLDTERIAAYQVALERQHFSCGFIDGDQGMRTQRMLRSFQTSRGLPVTGKLDAATRAAIGEPGDPFLSYTITPDDVASLMPKPKTWREKAQAKRLGYSDMWELLGEKFHCTRAYLKSLNHDVTHFEPGTVVVGPKVYPAAPLGKADSIRVTLSQTSIEALNASGVPIAFFPCSIAADKNKRPNGELRVKSVVPNPDYTFDPGLFKEASAAEGITKKMVIPPGPRNPVGTVWIGLSLPGYGMHGTPEPENISRTQSHGCFRLANWNAEKLEKMVRVGTIVNVIP